MFLQTFEQYKFLRIQNSKVYPIKHLCPIIEQSLIQVGSNRLLLNLQ